MKLDTRKTKSAVFLIDEKYSTSPKNNVPSGWDYDQRGSAFAKEHERNPAHSFTTSGDGYFVELYSSDNKTALCVAQKNGMFTVNGQIIACSVGSCNIIYTGLWINYLVCDRNTVRDDGALPYNWTDKSNSRSCASTSFYYEGENLYTYQLCASKKSVACAAKTFPKTGGKVCFDIKYLTRNPDGEGFAEVADWEIKYMAEHGLDCEFYCWYVTQQNAPFTKTHLCDALENGLFMQNTVTK